jgi:hypothetical protein
VRVDARRIVGRLGGRAVRVTLPRTGAEPSRAAAAEAGPRERIGAGAAASPLTQPR